MAILDLTTYKAYKNINNDKKDPELMSLINSVNSFIPNYCNRTFNSYITTDKTEYFDATQCEYYPEEFPIISITSLKYSANSDGVYDTDLDEHEDYVIDSKNSRIVQPLGYSFVSTSYPINSGEIVYKAGLTTLPEELVTAAVHLVEFYTEEAYTPRKSLAGSSIDSVIVPDLTARLPAHIRRTLEHHRAMVL